MNGRRVQIRSVVLAVVVMLMLTAAPVVHAQPGGSSTPGMDESSGPSFVLRPADGDDGSYIDLALDAGEAADVTILIANSGDEPLELRTFAADAFTLVNGGFGVQDEAVTPTEPTTWLDYEPGTFTFDPTEGIERTVTISVPPGTAPGQYITGVVAQTAEPLEIEGSANFRQIVRKVIAVLITVPGPVEPAFSLGEPALIANAGGATLSLSVPITNTGNVLVKPAGTMIMSGPDGEDILRAPLQLGSVYAGDETTIEIALPAGLVPADYTIDLALTDKATGAEATLGDVSVTIPAGGVMDSPMSFASVSLTPVPNDGTAVQYVDVAVVIQNDGDAIDGGQLVLTVARDGTEIERYALAASLALPTGPTTVTQRYIPAEGWRSGRYTFTLTVLAADQSAGTETVLATAPVDTVVDVP